ncbi:DUF4389 domain-containing protein [Porticoccus sp.]|uniref:DUF4389 domain-containing protein n=1 Tax=Porticoccus sp. TaxID=2024853 RepID=UPI003F69772A
MKETFKVNLLNIDTWIRLLYMILFVILLVVARFVVLAIAILQFLVVLVTGEDNRNLRRLGRGTGQWICQAVLFLTYNSEEKPYPFADWPETQTSSVDHWEDAVVDEIPDTGYTSTSDEDVPSFVSQKSALEPTVALDAEKEKGEQQ